MIMVSGRGKGGAEAQAAGHAQMQQQHATIQIDQEVFAAPSDAGDGLPDQCRRIDAERPAQGLSHAYRLDAGAGDALGEPQPRDFYFWQFRHGATGWIIMV